jgi:hypothetical protein
LTGTILDSRILPVNVTGGPKSKSGSEPELLRALAFLEQGDWQSAHAIETEIQALRKKLSGL